MDDYSPWALLRNMPHVRLRIADLGRDLLGFWDPDTAEIVLNSQQSRRQMRCTLMHELEHAQRGDEHPVDMPQVLAARQEIRTCVNAARRLIPLDRLLDVLRWTHEEQEICEELDVDADTLRWRVVTLTPEEHAVIDARFGRQVAMSDGIA